MADVVIASDDLVVLGGPSGITVELDIGAAGARGSQIFTDTGKPTSPIIEFPVPPQINDLYINLDPSDNEYLFLYQYKLDNAVLGWTKLLRLIPTTILFNPVLKFINGEAHTTVKVPQIGTVDLRGLYFPISGTLENENVQGLDYRDLNVQYSVISKEINASAVELVKIDTRFDVEYFNPITQTYVQVPNYDFGARFLFSKLKVVEFNALSEQVFINGYRKVDMVLTIAGRSELVKDIGQVNAATMTPPFPGSLTISSAGGHGLVAGDRISYLANGNTPITGLTDQADYYVAATPTLTDIVIMSNPLDPQSVITFVNPSFVGTHSILTTGALS